MKSSFLFLFFSSIIFLFACNNNASKPAAEPVSKVKELQKEVMKIHDEAMAKMDLIYRLKKQVKNIADSLLQDSTTYVESLTIARKNIELLEAADESMMNWMRNYKAPKDKSEEEAVEYLQSEQEKIEAVSKLMNENIAAAEDFVTTH